MLCCVAQERISEYFTRQWDNHHILVGENSLSFMKALSKPLRNEVDVFMVCDDDRMIG